jgi:hypothetical protein
MGQRNVTYVVVQMEMLVIDPHGRALQRHVRKSLSIPRDQFQTGQDEVADGCDVNPLVTY